MQQKPLSNRTALVTGSISGLGHGVAEALGRAGASIIVHGLCPPETGAASARRIAEATGADALFLGADLRDTNEIEALVDQALTRFGKIDIVVNNAVVRHFKPVEDFTPAEWDSSLAVNLSAAFHLARLTVPGMKSSGWGRIISLGSIYGVRGAENRIDYVTTKTALTGLTRALAVELARTGVTCNVISPGTVPTDAILDRIAGQAREKGISIPEAEAQYMVGRNPTGRFVAIESVAAAAVFLCSDAARDITGANLAIDGGWSAA